MIWGPREMGEEDPLQRGLVKVSAGDGITVLGVPVGSRGFVEEKLEEKVDKVRQITESLPLLKDPHCEFVLLRSCLALPKIMFLLRALDTSVHTKQLKKFDSITRGALSRILGSAVSDAQWLQAKLPAAMGGLGLRAAEDHAPIAFATSLLSSKTLTQKLLGQGDEEEPPHLPQPILDSIAEKQGEVSTAESFVGVPQRAASLKIDQFNLSLLLNHYTEEGDEREIARMASLGLQHAGVWLSVVPSTPLGLHLQPSEFVPCLKYRLGIPIFSSDGPCPACLAPSDRMGDHALGCAKYGERIARHDMLRDVIFEAAASAALAPVKEERHLLPGTAARPGDVFIRRWHDGKDGALDVTVTGPLAKTNVRAAATEAGSSLLKAFDRKVRGAAAACQQQGLVFLPLAVETLGGMHKVAVEQLKRLGAAVGRHQGSDERVATRQLIQRLSLTLMRGNAALMIGRRPDDDFATAAVDGVE